MTDQTRPLNPAAVVPQRLAVDLVEEIDQQRTRAETAEQERDQAVERAATTLAHREAAVDEICQLREQLAEASADASRYATQRDEARTTAEAMAQSVKRLVRERDRLLEANKAIIGENHNVREQLDRANTERQTLAQELADVTRDRDRLRETMAAIEAVRDSLAHDLDAMTAVARSNKQHVKLLTAIVERVESLTKSTDGDAIDLDAEIPVGEIVRVLNEALNAAPPVRPGSSRRAQEEPGRTDTEWWNRRALISDTLGRALWKCGHVVPLSVRDRCAEAVLAAQDAPAPPATVTLDNSAGRFVPAALPQPRRSFWHRVLQALARR